MLGTPTPARVSYAPMPTLTLSHLIDRPADDVFAVIADWTTLPAWDPAVRAVRQVSEGEPGLGSVWEFQFNGLGKKLMETTALEPDRLLEITPRSRLYRGGHRYTLTLEGDATRVSHLLTLNPRGPMRVLSPPTVLIARRILRRSAVQLQAYCEQR